jgi:hypothetical protein
VKIPENIPVKATPIIAKTKKTETNLVAETKIETVDKQAEIKEIITEKIKSDSIENKIEIATKKIVLIDTIEAVKKIGNIENQTIKANIVTVKKDSVNEIVSLTDAKPDSNLIKEFKTDSIVKQKPTQKNTIVNTSKPIVKDTTKTTKNLEVTYQKLNGKKVAVIKKNPTAKAAGISKDSITTRTSVNYAEKKIKVAVIEKPKVVSKELKKETTIEKIAETKIDTAPKSTNGITTETSARVIIKKDSVVKIMTTSEIEKIAEKKEVNEKVENPYATNEEIKTKKEIKDIQKSFTDYTILIIESPVPMKSDDKMLRYQLPILTHQKDSTYNYYLGEFKMWKDAEKYLSIVKRDYPNARIVDFYNGKEYDKK